MTASPTPVLGPNWQLLTRICAGLALVGLTLMTAPILVCTVSDVAGFETPEVAGDNARVPSDGGLLGATRVAWSACAERYAPRAAPIWQQATTGVAFILAAVFFVLTRISRKRALKLAAAQQRQARKSLRKERLSRPTGASGFDAVPRSGVSGAGDIVAESGPRTAVPGASFDPLAALDAEIARADSPHVDPPPVPQPRTPSAAPAALPRPTSSSALPTLDQLTDDVDSGQHDGWDSFAAEPFVRTAEAPTLPPAIGELERGAPAVSPIAETMPTEHAPTGLAELRDRAMADALADGETAPSVDPFGGIDGFTPPEGVALQGARFVEPVHVGKDIVVFVQGEGLLAASQSVQIAISVRALSGPTAPVWGTARSLRTAGKATAANGGVSLAIPWREVGETVQKIARREGDAAEELLVSITVGQRSMRIASQVLDSLVVIVRNQLGNPIEPRTVILRTADGRSVRGWVGARVPGQLEVQSLQPGMCRLEFEDGSYVGHHGGAPHRNVHLATNGVSYSDGAEPHQLWLNEPAVVFASPFADPDGTGTRSAPFASLADAIAFVRMRREANDARFAAAEIRLDPTGKLPASRHGLAPAGATQWQRWWAEATADVTVEWCTDLPSDRLRADALPANGVGFGEEIHLQAVEDLRIVNSAYAGLLDRIARSPGFEVDLGAELAAIPLVLSTAPQGGPTRGFRLEIERCNRVHIEGVHLLGCTGQSGVAIRDSRAVTLRRCWVDLFAAGTTRSGTLSVGRGVQIDNSGGGSVATAIVIETCDVGWNRAARRAVPVRGAGVSVHDSTVEMIHCHVHHNVATAAPPGLIAQGSSDIKGRENHRAANRVVSV